MSHSYTIYGGELSLFTRKLEAAMIFYGADFEVEAKRPEISSMIETRSGSHQIPVLKTPENWMLTDTTPIMRLLDGRFSHRAMFPSGNLGLLVHVLEDFFDEWVARVMVHYRWHYPDSTRFVLEKISKYDEKRVEIMRDWGPRACRATGTESLHQREAAEAEYCRILQLAETQLKETAFLLGDRPTAVDCMMLGGLRAHTNMDPDPKKVTAGYPTVIDWVERRADTWGGEGTLAPFPQTTPFARELLNEISEQYAPFVMANHDALKNKAKFFEVETYGEMVSYLTRPYPEQSRQMIIQYLDNMTTVERESLHPWLESLNLLNVFSN